MPIVGRSAGDRVEGYRIAAFYRKRSRERIVPLTRTHRGIMAMLYDAICIVEIPYKLKGK